MRPKSLWILLKWCVARSALGAFMPQVHCIATGMNELPVSQEFNNVGQFQNSLKYKIKLILQSSAQTRHTCHQHMNTLSALVSLTRQTTFITRTEQPRSTVRSKQSQNDPDFHSTETRLFIRWSRKTNVQVLHGNTGPNATSWIHTPPNKRIMTVAPPVQCRHVLIRVKTTLTGVSFRTDTGDGMDNA